MSRHVIIGYLLLIPILLGAQDSVHRAFLPVDTKTEKIHVLHSEASAFVVNSSLATTDLRVVRFDTLLQEVWALGLQRSQPDLTLVKAVDRRLFLVMSSASGKDMDVLELDEETGHYVLTSYSFPRPFHIQDFTAYMEHQWCSGLINNERVAFALDQATGGVKTLPVGFQAPILAVSSLRFDRKRKNLNLTLQSKVEGSIVFVHRILDLDGRIAANWIFHSPGGFNLKDLQVSLDGPEGLSLAVASYYKGNSEELKGLTLWIMNEAGEWLRTDYPWKDIPGSDRSVQLDRQRGVATVSKAKWKNGASRIEPLRTTKDGFIFGLDRFEKTYNVRGYLQREQDKEILVNQLDQNQFGRRGFDVNESTLDDRVETFSNTDLSTYQYRDVLAGPLEESGTEYAETWVFSIDKEGHPSTIMARGDAKSYRILAEPRSPLTWYQDKPTYMSINGGGIDLLRLHPSNPVLITQDQPMGPYTRSWWAGTLLNFGFVASQEAVYLFLQRYDFAKWAQDTPGSSGR